MLAIILFALSLGVFGAVSCFVCAWIVMAQISDKAALTVIGYSQLILIPSAGILGVVLGLALCLIGRDTSIGRWLIGAGILFLLVIIVNVGLGLMFGRG